MGEYLILASYIVCSLKNSMKASRRYYEEKQRCTVKEKRKRNGQTTKRQ